MAIQDLFNVPRKFIQQLLWGWARGRHCIMVLQSFLPRIESENGFFTMDLVAVKFVTLMQRYINASCCIMQEGVNCI
jgi:hypothetical protein